MCPAGVHEADLERMSMLVCKSEQKIKQIAYSQHAWSEVRDCQIDGQCQFDEVTGNPISYVALEGHGNYPESPGNGFHVYYYQGSSIDGFPLENIGGIYVGDRTGDDPSKTWIPTPDNVKYIPPLWEIQEEQNDVINGTSWQVCVDLDRRAVARPDLTLTRATRFARSLVSGQLFPETGVLPSSRRPSSSSASTEACRPTSTATKTRPRSRPSTRSSTRSACRK